MPEDEKQVLEKEEEPNCEDCLYWDNNFECTIGWKIINGKCIFYT